MTVIRLWGISQSMFLRLWTLAPRTITDSSPSCPFWRKASGCIESGGAVGTAVRLASKRDSSDQAVVNPAAVLASASRREVGTETAGTAWRLALSKGSPRARASGHGARDKPCSHYKARGSQRNFSLYHFPKGSHRPYHACASVADRSRR